DRGERSDGGFRVGARADRQRGIRLEERRRASAATRQRTARPGGRGGTRRGTAAASRLGTPNRCSRLLDEDEQRDAHRLVAGGQIRVLLDAASTLRSGRSVSSAW